MIKKDEIIFLFGAGISADAGIPTSSQMTNEVEDLILNDNDWSRFKDIYFLIKSGIHFSRGIRGENAIFNIETLMNILNELEKKETHPLYPFIGSWSVRFNEVVGNDFDKIKDFKKKIIVKLKEWMRPHDLQKSEYLKKLKDFKDEFEFPIRIFTLNYDLLIEKNLNKLKIERGFGEDRKWNHKRFYEFEEEPDLYLYKLHGSIDWERDKKTQVVYERDCITEEPDLIFGTQYKMQYIDPYLFMISEFRHYCLKAKLIVCLGYSFSDEHINAILNQSLSINETTKIFALAYEEKQEKIHQIIPKNRIKIITDKKAETFFKKELHLDTFKEFFQREDDSII